MSSNIWQQASLFKAISELDRFSQMYQVTPAFAAFLREKGAFPERQRNISAGNVKRLADTMRVGTFLPGTQIFVCVDQDGRWYLTNGNHTCEAIMASGAAQDLTLTFLKVADIDEAGRVYAVQDGQKVRTIGDKLKAIGEDHSLFARACASAITLIMVGLTGSVSAPKVRDMDQRQPYLDLYRQAMDDLEHLLDGAPSEMKAKFRVAPYLAVVLITMKDQPSKAQEFWGSIALDTCNPGTWERLLSNYMKSTSVSGNNERSAAWGKAVRAWNNFYNSEDAKNEKGKTKALVVETEAAILGTSFHKGAPKALTRAASNGWKSLAPSADVFIETGVIVNGGGGVSQTSMLRA